MKNTTLIHGTLRSEDLIPAFINEAKSHPLSKEEKEVLVEIEGRIKNIPDYFETEDAQFDLYEILFPLLNQYAMDGCYFGAHEGDGSDFGYWEFTDIGE